MTKKSLYSNVLAYAKSARIEMKATERSCQWNDLLPDMRGFTPHLRRVNLYKDLGLKGSLPWVIHDVLHILFYDFALLNLGPNCFSDPVRFKELHLASEAFAVLALDYNVLIHYPDQSLTVDLKATDWTRFRDFNPALPARPISPEFCEYLVDIYLTGNEMRFVPMKNPPASYSRWVGHELRYALKQRHYVQMWWEDLQGLSPSHALPEITGSFIHEAVWELLEILKSRAATLSLAKRVASKLSMGQFNCFKSFPKYKKSFPSYDYRFTDMGAVDIKPDALPEKIDSSTLYFFWQILSRLDRRTFSKREISQLKQLSIRVNHKGTAAKEWNSVKKIFANRCLTTPCKRDWSTISCFFLP